MKYTLRLILNTWGYAEKDGTRDYCRIEADHKMVFHDWDDVNNAIGYLVQGSGNGTVTFSIKVEKEEE